jgi:uncharacterized protein YifN (PemK superfamily)
MTVKRMQAGRAMVRKKTEAASDKSKPNPASLVTKKSQRTPNKPRKMAVVVLGMHRSGTSALTRIFSLLGCDLPKTLMGANKSNELGHWESTPICRLNDRILQSAGTQWTDWTGLNQSWFESTRADQFVGEAIQTVAEEFGDSTLFVVKDPRICRLVPFWDAVLKQSGLETVYALPVRNPLEVGQSLSRRNAMDVAIGQLLWLRYVLDAERGSRGLRRVFTTYGEILHRWPQVFERTSNVLGVVWPRVSVAVSEEIDAFIQPAVRHHEEADDKIIANPMASEWLRTSYSIFVKWASDGEKSADYSALDRIWKEFDAATPAFASIVNRAKESDQQNKELKHSVDQVRTEAVTLNEKLQKLSLERGQLKQELSAQVEKTQAGEARDVKRLAELKTSLAKVEVLERDRTQLQGAIAQHTDRQTQLEVELAKAAGSIASLTSELKSSRSNVGELERQRAESIAQEQLRQSQFDEQRSCWEGTAADLQSTIDASSERLADRENALAEKDRLLAQTRSDHDASQAQVESLHRDRARMEGTIERYTGRLAHLEAELAKSSDLVVSLTSELNSSRANVGELEREQAESLAQEQLRQSQFDEQRSRWERTVADLQSTIDASSERLADRENALAEKDRLLAQTRSDHDASQAQVESLHRDRARMEGTIERYTDRLAYLEAELSKSTGSVVSLTSELNNSRANVGELERQQAESIAQGRLRQSEIMQQRDELERTVADLQAAVDASSGRSSDYEAALAQKERLLVRARADLDASEASGEESKVELKHLQERMSETESALLQRRHEAEETAAELARALEELALVRANDENNMRRLTDFQEQKEEIDRQTNEIATLTKLLWDREKETMEVKNLRSRIESDAAQLREKLRAREIQAEAVERDLRERVDAMKGTLERQRAELTSLSRIVQNNEQKLVDSAVENAKSVGRAVEALKGLGRWPQITAKSRLKARMRIVEQSGLFDRDWYAKHYDDVAASGMDPLLHYVQFGAAEGRMPNAMTLREYPS